MELKNFSPSWNSLGGSVDVKAVMACFHGRSNSSTMLSGGAHTTQLPAGVKRRGLLVNNSFHFSHTHVAANIWTIRDTTTPAILSPSL
jgi:hypothetical protein